MAVGVLIQQGCANEPRTVECNPGEQCIDRPVDLGAVPEEVGRGGWERGWALALNRLGQAEEVGDDFNAGDTGSFGPIGGIRAAALAQDRPVGDSDEAICRHFPADQWANVRAVAGCESEYGRHPRTYDLNAAHGGIMQISKNDWADFFMETEGWTWPEIVLNDSIHFQAARIIWGRAGWVWSEPWPTCGLLAR